MINQASKDQLFISIFSWILDNLVLVWCSLMRCWAKHIFMLLKVQLCLYTYNYWWLQRLNHTFQNLEVETNNNSRLSTSNVQPLLELPGNTPRFTIIKLRSSWTPILVLSKHLHIISLSGRYWIIDLAKWYSEFFDW